MAMSVSCSCPAERRNLQARKCVCFPESWSPEFLNVFVLMCLQEGQQKQQQRGSIFPNLTQ